MPPTLRVEHQELVDKLELVAGEPVIGQFRFLSGSAHLIEIIKVAFWQIQLYFLNKVLNAFSKCSL